MKKTVSNNNNLTQTDTQPMTATSWKLVTTSPKYKNEETRPSPKIGGRRLSDLLKMIDLSG